MSSESVGQRDDSGHWKPDYAAEYMPLFRLPWRPLEVFKFLFKWGGYIWPRHVLYAGFAVLTWVYLQPGFDVVRTFSVSWALLMLGRNLVIMLLVFGFYHMSLYVWKWQGDRGKYHPKWKDGVTRKFLFGDQVKDNMFWSLVSGAPIWTAWEAFYLWMAANGRAPLIGWADNPYWFVGLFLLIPLWRETHFYFVHRLIHWGPLMRKIHSVHHKNPNPGPWSGMSMHPVEHLLYLSCIAIHFIIPSHPIHMFFNSQLTALTPAQGHTGFEGPLFGFWPAGDYFHYLHHKHVGCNFGVPVVPWDKWLGRYFNGEGKFRLGKSSK